MKKDFVLNRKKIISLFLKFPDCALKKHLIFCYCNIFKKNDFKIYYHKKKYKVQFRDFALYFPDNPYMQFSLYLKGYLKKFTPSEGNIVIDAGAFRGSFSIYASKIVGKDGLVIAFEPDKDIYKKLIMNIKLNNVKNIILIKKGLWNKETKLQFSNLSDGTANIDTIGKTTLPVTSLDIELKKMKISKIDFIKMDIEGAEIEAIEGCKNTLLQNNVKLAIASYHIVNGEKTCYKLEKLLFEYGYKTETSYPEHLTTYAQK